MKKEVSATVAIINKFAVEAPEAWEKLLPDVKRVQDELNRMVYKHNVISCLLHDVAAISDPRITELFVRYEIRLMQDAEFRTMYDRIQEQIRKKQSEVTDDVQDDDQQPATN